MRREQTSHTEETERKPRRRRGSYLRRGAAVLILSTGLAAKTPDPHPDEGTSEAPSGLLQTQLVRANGKEHQMQIVPLLLPQDAQYEKIGKVMPLTLPPDTPNAPPVSQREIHSLDPAPIPPTPTPEPTPTPNPTPTPTPTPNPEPTPTPVPQRQPTPTPETAQAAIPQTGTVYERVEEATIAEFGAAAWPAMEAIINHESGFNLYAVNPTSGACGLFQALPCSRMGGMGIDNQIRWGIRYIESRYGNPQNAWAFWQAHGWY